MIIPLYFVIAWHNKDLSFTDKWMVGDWSEWHYRMILDALLNIEQGVVWRLYSLHVSALGNSLWQMRVLVRSSSKHQAARSLGSLEGCDCVTNTNISSKEMQS